MGGEPTLKKKENEKEKRKKRKNKKRQANETEKKLPKKTKSSFVGRHNVRVVSEYKKNNTYIDCEF